jgi:hypothetical protein
MINEPLPSLPRQELENIHRFQLEESFVGELLGHHLIFTSDLDFIASLLLRE